MFKKNYKQRIDEGRKLGLYRKVRYNKKGEQYSSNYLSKRYVPYKKKKSYRHWDSWNNKYR